MKKIVMIVISMMMLMPSVAEAQIVVNKKPSLEKLVNLRMGWVSLNKYEDTYLLILQSDNQFDDSYIIQLGENETEAKQSLEALIEAASTIGKDDSMAFQSGTKEYRIYRGLVKGELWFKADGFAGWGKTSKMELNKLLKYFSASKDQDTSSDKFPDPLYE